MVARKKGIEVLVSIGIVLIVAAIILPVFQQSKGKSWNPCLRNMKQLGLAATMYRNDHDDRLPLAGNWETSFTPYTRGQELACNATPAKRHGYAMMAALSGRKGDTIKAPAEQVLFLESVALIPNAAGDERLLPTPGRHSGMNYFTYVDGHARPRRTSP